MFHCSPTPLHPNRPCLTPLSPPLGTARMDRTACPSQCSQLTPQQSQCSAVYAGSSLYPQRKNWVSSTALRCCFVWLMRLKGMVFIGLTWRYREHYLISPHTPCVPNLSQSHLTSPNLTCVLCTVLCVLQVTICGPPLWTGCLNSNI